MSTKVVNKSKMVLNEQTKMYMDRMICQREEKKLTANEEVQLFQDLYDSGYLYNLGDEYKEFAQRMIRVGLLKIKLELVTH